MGLTSNCDSIATAWQRRARVLESYMKAATKEAVNEVYAESKKQMQRLIYDKPVPTRAQEKSRTVYQTKKVTVNARGKKKAWVRTGNLKRSEKRVVASAYLGLIINDATSDKGKFSYARARHDMGSPGHRKTRYPAPWRANAIKIKHPKVRQIYRAAFRRAMREGAIFST